MPGPLSHPEHYAPRCAKVRTAGRGAWHRRRSCSAVCFRRERPDVVVRAAPELGAGRGLGRGRFPVVRYETDAEIALIDPFLPPDDSFDPRRQAGARPPHAARALPRHGRFRGALRRRRCGCRRRRAWRRRPNPSTTDELPSGVEAIELDGEPQQVVFFIREHATLVTGDVLSGTRRQAARLRRRGRRRAAAPGPRRTRRPADRARDHPARRTDPRATVPRASGGRSPRRGTPAEARQPASTRTFGPCLSSNRSSTPDDSRRSRASFASSSVWNSR